MFKKHVIYKQDKWNMITVEVQGRQLVLRELSYQWGEVCHTFLSRPALLQWAEHRFPKKDFIDNEEEWEQLMVAFRQV